MTHLAGAQTQRRGRAAAPRGDRDAGRESLGPQNQRFSFDQFAEQFRQQFGYALR